MKSNGSSMAVPSAMGPRGEMAARRTVAGTRIVLPPHLFLEDLVFVPRENCDRGRLRDTQTVLTLRIDWFHDRSPVLPT